MRMDTLLLPILMIELLCTLMVSKFMIAKAMAFFLFT